MGNKAILCFGLSDEVKSTSVLYMHWNGGPASVYALMDVAREHDMLTLTGVAFLARMAWPDGKTAYIDSGYESEEAMAKSAQDNGCYFITYGISFPRRLKEFHLQGVHHLNIQEVIEEGKAARETASYQTTTMFLRESLSAVQRIRYAWEEMGAAA